MGPLPIHMLAGAALAILLGGCSTHDQRKVESPKIAATIDSSNRLADGTFLNSHGEEVGKIAMLDGELSLYLIANLSGLPTGQHGFHLHQTGLCEGPGFATAKGHLNPMVKTHGSLSENGSHLGDLPNLSVNEEGSATIKVDIGGGTKQQILDWLFDNDGTSIMVHAQPDDYTSDPTGNAGPRIACAVLTR